MRQNKNFSNQQGQMMADYTLAQPKTVDGQEITTLTVREMELDDVISLSELDQNDLRALKAFLAKVTEVDERIIGRLSMSDFQGLMEAATGPLARRPGAMPSASDAKSATSMQPT